MAKATVGFGSQEMIRLRGGDGWKRQHLYAAWTGSSTFFGWVGGWRWISKGEKPHG